MTKKLTILLIPLDAFGHVNPMIGVGQQLLERGHRIVFVLDKSWEGKLLKYGFEEEIYCIGDPEQAKRQSEEWLKLVVEYDFLKNVSPLEKMKGFSKDKMLEKSKVMSPIIKDIIDRVKPNVVIVDTMFMVPTAFKGQKWVNLNPSNGMCNISSENQPPFGSGYPSYDKSEWGPYMDSMMETFAEHQQKFSEFFSEYGLPPLQEKIPFYHSPYLNIYAYPDELDFTDLRQNPPNFYRFDSFIRLDGDPIEVPDKLKNLPGKLIYFSLGSLGSADIELAKRLIGFLGQMPHRFIVSKGAYGDRYDLPDNCWGQNMVPQTRVLPMVDLAIIHGGNNSLCETFYFGKPMIVIPLFGDQYDNAQRVQEKGFGIRMNPFTCTKEELENAIETLLNDHELNEKLKKIAERSKNNAKSNNELCKLIESVADKELVAG